MKNKVRAMSKNPERILQDLRKKPERYWIKRGEKMALRLFRQMAERVPAYKDFLRKNRVNPEKIKTIKDFKLIPTVDKDNYLRKYHLEKLCWDGKFNERQWVFATTSGSTGKPFYFPREDRQDWQYTLTAELYLRTNFEIHKKSTLYINSFAMGAWIGGVFTYQAIRYLSMRGKYRLSIITPGINKDEIIKAVKNLGPKFEQIIIGGYPPFVKDTIDYGINQGIEWARYNLGIIFSAEGFSEEFRDYVVRKAALKNHYKDTLNHYGTVDLGTMSYETPLCILIRKRVVGDNAIHSSIFSRTDKLPTLTQFMPEMFYFEEMDGRLVCSAYSGLPLVRYDLKDTGGVFSLDKITERFSDHTFDLYKEAKKTKIDKTIWNLPFVYVYERSDLTVSLYGANIYPETIKMALQNKALEKSVTGRFTMLSKHDKNQDQYLEINIELKPSIKQTGLLRKKVQGLIITALLKDNAEYRTNYENMGERVFPKIVFWPYEDKVYFKSDGKQKWVKR
jgi:phenylacetate-CoA ligase